MERYGAGVTGERDGLIIGGNPGTGLSEAGCC